MARRGSRVLHPAIKSVTFVPTPHCPICTQKMRAGEGENATSRYVPTIVICGGCATKEAFSGFYWSPFQSEVEKLAKRNKFVAI